MKRIVILSLLGALLSGCVVVPGAYYDDGYRRNYYYGRSYYGDGYYRGGYYAGGYYSGYRGTWDHGQ